MAAPQIDETTSVLAFRRGEFITYQPAALNTPTGWTASALPAGLTINATTGKISGTPTEPGFYLVTLTATNVDGSDQFIIKIGIEAVAFNADAFVEVDIEIGSGKVTNPAIADSGKPDVPVIYGKMGDWLLLSVGFTKGGVLQPLSLSQLDLALKEFEPEVVLVITEGAFATVGSYDTQRQQIAVKLDPDALRPILSSYEADRATEFDAVAEFRWGLQHILPGDEDPSILEGSSQNFVLRVTRDLAPDIEEEE
jgi:hypothetical protein